MLSPGNKNGMIKNILSDMPKLTKATESTASRFVLYAILININRAAFTTTKRKTVDRGAS
jgi:rhamnogalacturonyl hydrolase YesR